MKIIRYTNDQKILAEYLKWVSAQYSHHKNFDYFFTDLKKSLSEDPFQKRNFIALYDKNKLVGHVALIQDSRLSSDEAFWGFFECENRADIFNALWEELKKLGLIKKINLLKGPINGTIWHQYRFLKSTDKSPFFSGELLCQDFYYNFLKDRNSEEILYYSAYRDKFDKILEVTMPYYEQSQKAGFRIITTKSITLNQLHSIFAISKNIFKSSWGYIELSENEFLSLYSSNKILNSLFEAYLLYKDKQLIGYCTCLKSDDKVLILKTIAILPEFQRLGLANALIYLAHQNAKSHHYKRMIYALIRNDNRVKNLPKDDAVIFREYAAFEIKT